MCAGTTRRHERARSALDYNVLDQSPDSPIGYARRPSRLLFVFHRAWRRHRRSRPARGWRTVGVFRRPTLSGGLAFGHGGVPPLDLSENIIHTGAEIGVLLLLFMLGLQRFRQ